MGNTIIVEHNSIGSLVKAIENGEFNDRSFDRRNPASEVTGKGAEDFTQTKDFEEAKNLLFKGWTEGSKRLTTSLKLANLQMGNVERQKMYNDVVGFQAHVPNYLMGIPTSMINKKKSTQKQKTITLIKSIAYSAKITTEQILEDSTKFLQIVQQLEKQGIKVNIYVMFHAVQASEQIIIKTKIKNASERLNIAKMSFPLLHPSFLRRIILKALEVNNDLKLKGWYRGYGSPARYEETKPLLKENEIYIPTMISERKAIDIVEGTINKTK